MKHKHFPQDQNSKTAGASRLATAGLNANEINFAPSPDEVARRAYFTYENEGSLPGHDVQHWLQAETQLIAERKLTMVHGYHNPT
jgi:Fe-S cluster biosynthesis and repair protein YggX